MPKIAFFAYPQSSQSVTDPIREAGELSKSEDLRLQLWEKLPTIGFKLDNLIRDRIDAADALVADITYPNPNVFYEIGFAHARGKPVIPTINTSIDRAIQRVQNIGLFDTTGWLTYDNSRQLSDHLRGWNDFPWKSKFGKKRDHTQPLFFLDTLKKTDFRNHIISAIDNSGVRYRRFDPAEIPRLTSAQAMADVSASAGVIVPLLSEDVVDSGLHNLRASFILGLAHGFSIETLAIQYENKPVPLDYRDYVTNSTYKHETEKHVAQYCAQTLVRNQEASSRTDGAGSGLLGEINIGSPAAENEVQNLTDYFVETAEFSRALRAEGGIVSGRKGAGKSAVFFQIAEKLGKDRTKCIVDLRPASHNLSEMREALLSVVSAGVFDHTIAAFWQHIVYVEIILKIREMTLPRSRNDFALQGRIRHVEEKFSLHESAVAGDFTSRLEASVQSVIRKIEAGMEASDVRKKITNLMFENDIHLLREEIASFSDHYSEIIVLIDDLDKGWPPRRVEDHDVSSVRHLIEVLSRIQRDLSRKRIAMRHLVFLRSDIYERLVEQTSDRGKYNLIKLDWSDKEQLRRLLRERVISSVDQEKREAAWNAISPSLDGVDAIDVMIENSLRRPRFLIDLCERTLSFAINRGHRLVQKSDVEEGLRQMSLYLVSDFAYEMRDVSGMPEDVFYKFIGCGDLLTSEEIYERIRNADLEIGEKDALDLFLWYGFLGVISANGKAVFIYDTAYDFRRLEAEKGTSDTDTLYAVNSAFLLGLKPN